MLGIEYNIVSSLCAGLCANHDVPRASHDVPLGYNDPRMADPYISIITASKSHYAPKNMNKQLLKALYHESLLTYFKVVYINIKTTVAIKMDNRTTETDPTTISSSDFSSSSLLLFVLRLLFGFLIEMSDIVSNDPLNSTPLPVNTTAKTL